MSNTNFTPVIAMDAVKSSQIHSIGYDAEIETLAIRFIGKDGAPAALWHYAKVTAANFDAFRTSPSLGAHFHRHIKALPARFPSTLIEKSPSKAAPVNESSIPAEVAK